jgi:hypothetical protein
MGFWNGIGPKIRQMLQWDKEAVTLSLAKGGTGSSQPQSGFDLLQAYGYDALADYLKLEQDLMSRYIDLEEMDDSDLCSTALDIYADDATTVEPLKNRSVWVDSTDQTVTEILDDLFQKRLRIGEEDWSIARTLAKYGQNYEELLVSNDGLVGTNYLSPPTMRRIEGRRGELFGFVQDFRGKFGYSPDEFKQLLAQRSTMQNEGPGPFDKIAALEPWEVCHMRLRSKQRRSLYGTSVMEAGRWVWKRLMLLEDAAMVYRLQRAPERYAFYVDVGDLPPKEAFAYLNKIRQQYKKTKFYSPSTGKLDLKNNPLGADQDFFMPIRKGVQGTRIDVLQSPTWTAMDDINYFREKLFAALKVPKTYLGFSESVGKGSLSQEDVRFSKAVLRLQREMRSGFHKMARVHLASMNINPNALDYEIYMTVPSSIFELAQLEVRNAKADFAGRMSQFVSMHWILQKIFGLSDTEIEFVIKQRHDEQLMDADVQAKSLGMQQQTSMDVQMQAQQDQQGQAMQAAGQMAKAEPNTKKSEDAQHKLRELASLSRIWPQKRQQLGYRPISESELFAGNRDHERRIEDNLEKVLKYDTEFSRKLNELGGLVRELRGSMPRK